MSERDEKLRALIKQWRKMTEPGSYGVAGGIDINVGRAATIASMNAYKKCADQLEKIADQLEKTLNGE